MANNIELMENESVWVAFLGQRPHLKIPRDVGLKCVAWLNDIGLNIVALNLDPANPLKLYLSSINVNPESISGVYISENSAAGVAIDAE